MEGRGGKGCQGGCTRRLGLAKLGSGGAGHGDSLAWVNETRAEFAVAAHVQTIDGEIAEWKEHVTVLEKELAQAKDHLKRLQAAKGRGVDQAALRRARSLWAQAKRRHKEFPDLAEYGPDEIKRLKREYEALKAKS
jgi:phage protein D